MKENKLVKFTSLVMFMALFAIVMVSGTYAKYSSSASGTDAATVAKWDIKAGKAGQEVSITGSDATVGFELFDTILDTNGEAETDVLAGRIAPGTQGAFELSIKNDSEVDAEYTVDFTVSGAEVPLEFRVNNGAWTSSLSSISAVRLAKNASTTAKVEWRWVFDGNDVTDTALGTADSKNVQVKATLAVSQVD